MLVAEGWAEPAADGPQACTPTDEEVRCIREQLENWSEPRDRRRAEDRIPRRSARFQGGDRPRGKEKEKEELERLQCYRLRRHQCQPRLASISPSSMTFQDRSSTAGPGFRTHPLLDDWSVLLHARPNMLVIGPGAAADAFIGAVTPAFAIACPVPRLRCAPAPSAERRNAHSSRRGHLGRSSAAEARPLARRASERPPAGDLHHGSAALPPGPGRNVPGPAVLPTERRPFRSDLGLSRQRPSGARGRL